MSEIEIEIEIESQSLASSEIANEMFQHLIASLSEADRQSISRSLSAHQDRIRNLNELARRNHSSSGSQLSRLSSRLAHDWTARSSKDREHIRRASPQLVRPLSAGIMQEINQTPIRRIQNTAHLLRVTPISGAAGESSNISQIRQSS